MVVQDWSYLDPTAAVFEAVLVKDISPEKRTEEYLTLAKLAVQIGDALFVHGGLPRACLGEGEKTCMGEGQRKGVMLRSNVKGAPTRGMNSCTKGFPLSSCRTSSKCSEPPPVLRPFTCERGTSRGRLDGCHPLASDARCASG